MLRAEVYLSACIHWFPKRSYRPSVPVWEEQQRGDRICPSLILLLVISIRCVIGSVFDETEWSMLPIPSQKTRETRLIKDCSYPHFLRVPDTFLNTKPMRHAFSG